MSELTAFVGKAAGIDTCTAGSAAADAPDFAKKAIEAFTEAVNDDLNVPKAFAALFELVRSSNAWMQGEPQPAQAAALLETFRRMDCVLGVIFFGKAAKAEIPAEIQGMLDMRAEARKAKNWAESDRLRDEIKSKGYAVEDAPGGTYRLKKL